MTDIQSEQYDQLRYMYGKDVTMNYLKTKDGYIDQAVIATEALDKIASDISADSRKKRVDENVAALLSPWISSIIVVLLLGVYYVGYTTKKVTSAVLFVTAALMTILTPALRRSASLYYKSVFSGRSTLEEQKIRRTIRIVTDDFYTKGPLMYNKVQQTLMNVRTPSKKTKQA